MIKPHWRLIRRSFEYALIGNDVVHARLLRDDANANKPWVASSFHLEATPRFASLADAKFAIRKALRAYLEDAA